MGVSGFEKDRSSKRDGKRVGGEQCGQHINRDVGNYRGKDEKKIEVGDF